MSLTTVIADSFGISERHAHRVLAVGERLQPNEVALLDAPGVRVGLADLAVLSKISEPTDRADVLAGLVKPKPVSASKGWAAVNASKAGVQPIHKDPVDEAFKALTALWSRAPKPAKRRFVDELQAELARLLAEAASGDI